MAKRTSDNSASTKVTHLSKSSTRTLYHKDGSIWARGPMLGDKMHGYWEFFRKDGTIMRSGMFDREQQIGTWTTYDAAGKPVKVTEFKPAAQSAPGAREAQPRKSAKPKRCCDDPANRKPAKKKSRAAKS